MLRIITKYLKLLALCFTLTYYSCGSGEYETGETKEGVSGNPQTETTNKLGTEKLAYELPNKGLFTIQLGAFIDEANAVSLLNSAKQFFSDDVYYNLINDLYKVRVGLFTSETEAAVVLEKIKKKGFGDSFIVLN